MKVCVSCQLPKEEEEFNWHWKALGIRAKICGDCQHGHQRTWYLDHQEQEKERTRRRRVKVREEPRDFVYSYQLTLALTAGRQIPVFLTLITFGEKVQPCQLSFHKERALKESRLKFPFVL
jgi:hypothetical protein